MNYFCSVIWIWCGACVLAGSVASAADRADMVIADFEGENYGDWTTDGEAFGRGPARGTLPGQMAVSGYEGRGLVNSFFKGDSTKGTLTSPAFTIERRYLNFLLGGGHHPGETCVNLLVDGKVVQTATGPQIADGGSEQLEWQTWDLAALAGKQATIQIVDRHTGGWGHVNVDQITLSDKRRQTEPAARELTISEPFLNLPVRTGAPKRRMRFVVDGRVVREFDIELADRDPGFWTPADVRAFRQKSLRVEVDRLPVDSQVLTAITQSATPNEDSAESERQRPRFHFTSRRGWLNDPNGLVYDGQLWHLYYQHNPFGWNWGNMHWGHATSKNLVDWQEQPEALFPQRYGDWCFSGSALVDRQNSSGFKKGDNELLVLAYTSTGRGECIAYSNDRGQTWTEYEGNPVVKHQGRDPRLLWHAASKRFVMAVYDEFEGKQWIAFYTSSDLKKWQFQSRILGFFECPDLFELAVDDDPAKSRWVLYGADSRYVIGAFDGAKFQIEVDKQTLWHGNFYAAQTFSNAPDNRRVQIGWGREVTFPGAPFNQQMTIPVELTLHGGAKSPRLRAWPVAEVAQLREKQVEIADQKVSRGENPFAGLQGSLLDIECEVALAGATSFGFNLQGTEVIFDVAKEEVRCGGVTARLPIVDGRVRLRLLRDRGSIELFGNGGDVAISAATRASEKETKTSFFTRGGDVQLHGVKAYELREK